MDLTLPESQEPEISPSLGHFIPKDVNMGTSLVVQWLGLQAVNAGRLGSIPGQGTRSHMKQPRVHLPQLRPGKSRLVVSSSVQPRGLYSP